METTNPEYAFSRKAELLEGLQLLKEEHQLDWIFFSVVDILAEKNATLVIGDSEEKAVKSAFGCTVHDRVADLGNRLSRKKELEPALRKYFESLL